MTELPGNSIGPDGRPDPRTTALAELQPAEKLKWAGSPDPSQAWRPFLPIFLFAIPWTLFAIFWEAMALTATTHTSGDTPAGFGVIFPLFGLPFVAVGVGMLASPFFGIRKARNTVYAITDRRAMVIQCGSTRTVRSFGPADITGVTRTEKPDGSGDIVFVPAQFAAIARYAGRTPGSTTNQTLGFFGVQGVRFVEQALQEMLQGEPGEQPR